MADLGTKDSSQMVSITGADSSGGETNVVNANTDGELLTSSRLKGSTGDIITSTDNAGKKALDVNVTNSFAAGTADKSTFTYGSSIENSVGGVYQDTSPTLTPGQQGAVRVTENRAFHTNLRSSSGAEIGTVLDVAGNTNLLVAATHNIFVSTNNSTTTNLASGATFTGTSDINLNATTIQINIKCDQPLTVVVEQSNDNVNWDFEDSYYLEANTDDSRLFLAAGSYVRVLLTNNGTSTTTYLNLQTILVPIQTVAPRNLTKEGNLRVSIEETSNKLDNILNADRSIFGSAITSIRIAKLIGNFSNGVSSVDATTSTTGGGSVNSANSMAVLTSGTATSATAKLITNQMNTYFPGRESFTKYTAKFTAPTNANSHQRIGLFDTNNGFFIGYNGTSFGISSRTGGSDTFVSRSSWNGDLLNGNPNSKFTRDGVPEPIDLTKLNVFRIRFGWLGSASCSFEVLSPDSHWIEFHILKFPNTLSIPSILKPDLPFCIEVTKTSSDATSLSLSCGSFECGTADNPNAYGIEDINGRKYVTTNVAQQTTSQTIYTVSTNRVLKVTSIIISFSNSSLVNIGQLNIRDGNGGTIIIPMTSPSSTNQSNAGNNLSLSFPVPVRFSTSMYAQIASGVLTYNVTFVGYESEIS